jgi:predicted HTH transcriptional regulator
MTVSRYIFDLIDQGEHQQLDFKFEISDSKKIAKTLSSFANTDGGKLLIGVKDNGKIKGVRTDEEFHMIEAAAQLYCKPEVAFTSKSWPVNGKSVLEVIIREQASIKPVLARGDDGKWEAYIRVKDENFIASNIVRRIWQQEDSKAVFLEYTEKEKQLLQYIDRHGSISVSQFTRIAYIPRRNAEKILVDLTKLNILDFEVDEFGTRFGFTDEFDLGAYEIDMNAFQK